MISLVWFCLAMFQQGDGVADPPTEADLLRGQIQDLDQSLERLQAKYAEMKQRSEKLSDEVGRLNLQKAVVSAKVQKHELQLEEANSRIQQNELQKEELLEKSLRQKETILKRLRQLYKRGTLGHSKILLKQSRISELISAYHYAKVMTNRDHQTLKAYEQTIHQLETLEKVLTGIRAEAGAARDQLAVEEKSLRDLLNRRSRTLKEIRKKAETNKRLFEELELEKEELRLMVRRLSEADADPMTLRVPVSKYKGRLNWPTKGSLFRKFGVVRDPEFKTERKQNGIDIRVPKGRSIRAVYSGRVMYADWFKSYGNLIIIDHGEKVISFYAHCDRMNVSKGDYVERDQIVGLTGDSGSLDGPMLHFEVRDKTRPVDPLTWLRRSKGRR